MFNLIYAENNKGVIGSKGTIPWNVPEELDYFKIVTLGSMVAMGRLTWESLPKKPLPYRTNAIITSRPKTDYDPPLIVTPDLNMLRWYAATNRVFVIGGEGPLRAAMPEAKYVYRTIVDDNSEGDTFAPNIDMDNFQMIHNRKHISKTGIKYNTQILKRK